MAIFAGAPVSKGLILSWIAIFAIKEMGGGKIIVSKGVKRGSAEVIPIVRRRKGQRDSE